MFTKLGIMKIKLSVLYPIRMVLASVSLFILGCIKCSCFLSYRQHLVTWNSTAMD